MSPAILGAAVRWILFAAVLVSTGAAAFRFAVMGRLTPGDTDALALHQRVMSRAAGLAAVAAAVGLGAALARLPLQFAELGDNTIPMLPQVTALTMHTTWGAAWFYQVAALIAACGAFITARRGGTVAWCAAALFAVLAAASPAFSGHAIGSERLMMLAVAADVLHVCGAAAWLGAMVVLFASLALVQRDAGAGASLARAMVSAFSPLALGSALLVLVTGLLASWLHLGTVSALWQSRYGKTLIFKLAAVGLMTLAGALNWRKHGPELQKTGQIGPMRRSIRWELLVGALVVLATAILVVTPEPGQE